ncbi:MAG: purine-nucleoside phosphorylase [Lachnospiraceae bacterium]|nr:purine-nucleoside phosphorylase [Lachnospiraceae bacterium]MBQ9233232.1 purine-nucleoside phosphorylase [Lachnospiraceae bacterium]
MTELEKELLNAFDSITFNVPYEPEIALILGSGLGNFAENIEDKTIIEYKDIPYFPVSTVSGHEGRFIIGKLSGKKIIAMQGRVHYYEGYSMAKVVMPIRLMKLLGAKTLILTNAAGGINESFNPGTLMAIKDHITSFVPSPLIGENPDSLGVRFPDMSSIYDKELLELLKSISSELDIDLKDGVYLQTTGPNYETPAEINMYKLLGADAVGMSTACEAMAASHMGMRIAGISCITNMAAGISKTALNHDEVKETANQISNKFSNLVKEFIKRI